jgi:hypothetical protein
MGGVEYLIWVIYCANVLPIWQNISNQIQQILSRNTYIVKPDRTDRFG